MIESLALGLLAIHASAVAAVSVASGYVIVALFKALVDEIR